MDQTIRMFLGIAGFFAFIILLHNNIHNKRIVKEEKPKYIQYSSFSDRYYFLDQTV